MTGKFRKEMEHKTNIMANILMEWCSKHKLEISVKKSHILLPKGFLDIKRPPTVRMGDKTLKMVLARYLEVHFRLRMGITSHVNYIYQKSKKIFSQLAGVAGAQ